MPFTSMKLKPESGANRIKSADDAYSFVAHMRLSNQNKPHWQAARQAMARQTRTNFRLGERFGLLLRPKAGSRSRKRLRARQRLRGSGGCIKVGTLCSV
jgi:hypothetical protein